VKKIAGAAEKWHGSATLVYCSIDLAIPNTDNPDSEYGSGYSLAILIRIRNTARNIII
jgi:hypothetical protein